MKAKIKDGVLHLELPLNPNPPSSKSGKTLIIYTTSGFTQLKDQFDNKTVSLSINATIKK